MAVGNDYQALAQYTPAEVLPEEWNLRGLLLGESLFLPPRRFTADALAAKEREELFALLYEAAAAVARSAKQNWVRKVCVSWSG